MKKLLDYESAVILSQCIGIAVMAIILFALYALVPSKAHASYFSSKCEPLGVLSDKAIDARQAGIELDDMLDGGESELIRLIIVEAYNMPMTKDKQMISYMKTSLRSVWIGQCVKVLEAR